MEYSFIDDIVEQRLLLKSDFSGVNALLLENNAKQLEKLYDFFKSEKPLMLLNGFLGTGKSQVVNHFLTLLKPEAIVLKYNCYETTILDDILLSFFEDFRAFTAENRIHPPKNRHENFVQKISAYFNSIDVPIVIVLDSFEEVLKDNRGEILDFLAHLSTLGKIKVVIISRVFDYAEFEGKIEFDMISVGAFDKPIFEKYLRSCDIKLIGPVSDELYKYTRGYYFYTTLAIKIMQMRGLNLFDFLNGFTKTFLSYNDFILREALAFVDPVSGHLFRFLTIMRHPVSIKLLKTLNLYDEMKIRFFVNNMLLSLDGKLIYLQDYYKEIAENSIPDSVAVKLHRSCVDLYNTQLPLKPMERDLLISRGTMRTEIEYHSMFLPKKPQIRPQVSPENANLKPAEPILVKAVAEEKKEIKNISFIFDNEEVENTILTKIADSINEFLSFSEEEIKEIEKENKLSLVELINLAKQEENNYKYKRVVMIYQRALAMNSDDDYYTFLPVVYSKLAQTYGNLSDWFNSLKYFEEALKFYTSSGDFEKISEIKLEIANIYYITFKREQAKQLLEEILNSSGLSVQIYMRALISLADLVEDNLNVSYDYYKRAIEFSADCCDKKLLAELYFKFAVASDDLNEPKQAVQYYKKCIEIDKKLNEYLSSSYSNLALISEDAKNPDAAMRFYQESLKIDEENKNLNGIYISSMKLAELNRRKNSDVALAFYTRAQNAAKEMNEPFYLVSAMTAIGDFYTYLKNPELALGAYNSAKEFASGNLDEDNIKKIDGRIEDIKAQISEEKLTNGNN